LKEEIAGEPEVPVGPVRVGAGEGTGASSATAAVTRLLEEAGTRVTHPPTHDRIIE